jgi:hypothetical protein
VLKKDYITLKIENHKNNNNYNNSISNNNNTFYYVCKNPLSNDTAKEESKNSWTLRLADIDPNTFDLSAKNPNKKDEVALRKPEDILEEMKTLDEESKDILNSILELL